MGTVRHYLDDFFRELEVFEDVARGHDYKTYLHQSIREFLDDENKTTAFGVYTTFFDSYRIKMGESGNPFVDLLDTLRSYEENAATLIDKQRDHYIHSVNVFILGLCIYAQNRQFRDAFQKTVLDKSVYPDSYDTHGEEFFYRWGLAALFHDVGYPIEIIGKQAVKFINFATDVDGDETHVQAYLAYKNFGELNSIVEVVDRHTFAKPYFDKYGESAGLDPLKPLDLLALKLHVSLGVPLDVTRVHLENFINVMADCGFIDHGFFSAIIVLKWYGFLMQKSGYKPAYFYYPVLDSASAILLHNYYRNVLQKAPFRLPPLHPEKHPIAYLLILCDELQEWNRQAYGIIDRQRTGASDASLLIADRRMEVTYMAKSGRLPDDFGAKKEALLYSILDLNAVFPDGFAAGCASKDALHPMVERLTPDAAAVPRPLFENMEQLAIAIHNLYNKQQLERHPDRPLDYPRFADLPDSLKYSCLRQARAIPDKLHSAGMTMLPRDSAGEKIESFPTGLVETLSIMEHESWMKERLDGGWTFSPTRDREKKLSPYLVPYKQLPDEIKELDRDTIRNIPVLLDMIGMAVFKI